MTTGQWNYKELGFDSVDEMNASIERVKAEQRLTPHELAQKKYARSSTISDEGGIDLEAVYHGARLNQLDTVVKNKMLDDKARQRLETENKALAELMSKVSDSVAQTKQTEAEADFNKQKAKAEAELQKEIYGRHGVTTDAQAKLDDSYRNFLGKVLD